MGLFLLKQKKKMFMTLPCWVRMSGSSGQGRMLSGKGRLNSYSVRLWGMTHSVSWIQQQAGMKSFSKNRVWWMGIHRFYIKLGKTLKNSTNSQSHLWMKIKFFVPTNLWNHNATSAMDTRPMRWSWHCLYLFMDYRSGMSNLQLIYWIHPRWWMSKMFCMTLSSYNVKRLESPLSVDGYILPAQFFLYFIPHT